MNSPDVVDNEEIHVVGEGVVGEGVVSKGVVGNGLHILTLKYLLLINIIWKIKKNVYGIMIK